MNPVFVIGAGLAGQSAACYLTGRGHDLTVTEREELPGGRAPVLHSVGFTFDTGPTALTMPDPIAEDLRAASRDPAAKLNELMPMRWLNPALEPVPPTAARSTWAPAERRCGNRLLRPVAVWTRQHSTPSSTGCGILSVGDAEPSGAGTVSDWISHEARLTEGYRRCAMLTWRYGTIYFWGAALLPKPQRQHVHAVYALCRLADDIVDLPNGTALEPEAGHTPPESVPTEPDSTLPDLNDCQAAASDRLEDFAASFRNNLAAGDSADPMMAAVVHTVITCSIDPESFDRFFRAMALDLTTTSYQTWEDLRCYMEGWQP